MSSTTLCAAILLACTLTLSAAHSSCKGRCGAEYDRGSICQCDYNCLTYDECCRDYESQCTTKSSCLGRCGENFKRGRLCSCDPECVKYNQCCSDFKGHCDAPDKIKGASATEPMKDNSCPYVNDNKPKDPYLTEATEDDYTFNEQGTPDDSLFPTVSQVSDPQDDLTDDTQGQIFPTDEFSNGEKDQEATPIPESTSGYGSPTADPLDQPSTEPTAVDLELGTEASVPPSDASDPTEPSGSGPPPPEPTAAVEPVPSSQPASTSASDTDTPTTQNPEVENAGQAEAQLEADVSSDAQVADVDNSEIATTAANPTVASATPEPTQGSSTVPDSSQDITTQTPTTPGPTTDPVETTTAPSPDDPDVNPEDVTTDPPTLEPEAASASASPAGSEDGAEPEVLTSPLPTGSTVAPQDIIPERTTSVTTAMTTAEPPNITPEPTEPTLPEATTKPQDKPEPGKPEPAQPAVVKPSPKPEIKPPTKDDARDFQGDDSETDLCSGRPISGVTTLRNGTIVVFRGHYFWFLDSNRVPGPARGITQVWGVPSPIDTVFTRCNCQGKTYIFKGPRYWRFENDVLDSGYPKIIHTGFDGLRGHITAALSVPQYQSRRESVYFFKRGGSVQKYSYQFGTSPTCDKKPQYTVYTVRNRVVRQAVSVLGPPVNIRTAWRGFPSTITAAVSIRNNREPEGYKYYVFSRSKSYNVRMDAERPVIAPSPPKASPQSNDVFKCPQKV